MSDFIKVIHNKKMKRQARREIHKSKNDNELLYIMYMYLLEKCYNKYIWKMWKYTMTKLSKEEALNKCRIEVCYRLKGTARNKYHFCISTIVKHLSDYDLTPKSKLKLENIIEKELSVFYRDKYTVKEKDIMDLMFLTIDKWLCLQSYEVFEDSRNEIVEGLNHFMYGEISTMVIGYCDF